MKTQQLKPDSLVTNERMDKRDDFKPVATYTVLALLIAFIVSSIYILIIGYFNIT